MLKRSLLTCLALCGCAYVNPQGVAQMSAFSPLTTDPAELRAVVSLPMGVEIPPNGAVLTFAATRTDTGDVVKAMFDLMQLQTAQGDVIVQMATDDADAYRAVQRKIAQWEDAAPDETRGSFSISVAACRVGDGPAEDATFSVALATTEDGRFIPLVEDAPIKDALALAEGGPNQKKCG